MTRCLSAWLLVLFCCGPLACAQAQTADSPSELLSNTAAAKRPDESTRRVQEFLRTNPALRAGINLPDGTTIKALRPITGGIRYRITGLPRGQVVIVDVTGPPSVLTKAFLDTLWDGVKKIAAAVDPVFASANASSPGAKKPLGCLRVHVNGRNNTVNITGGVDSQPDCGDIG